MVFNLMCGGARFRLRWVASGYLVLRNEDRGDGWHFAGKVDILDLVIGTNTMHYALAATSGGQRCATLRGMTAKVGGEVLMCLPWLDGDGRLGGIAVLYLRDGWIAVTHHAAIPSDGDDELLMRDRISRQIAPPPERTSTRRHPAPPHVHSEVPDMPIARIAEWMQDPAAYDRQRAAEAQARSAA